MQRACDVFPAMSNSRQFRLVLLAQFGLRSRVHPTRIFSSGREVAIAWRTARRRSRIVSGKSTRTPRRAEPTDALAGHTEEGQRCAGRWVVSREMNVCWGGGAASQRSALGRGMGRCAGWCIERGRRMAMTSRRAGRRPCEGCAGRYSERVAGVG